MEGEFGKSASLEVEGTPQSVSSTCRSQSVTGTCLEQKMGLNMEQNIEQSANEPVTSYSAI
ncbi:hypothetical protein [Paenibacillus sp. FSL R5-0701]|uniref:hypothetical protein n=1 Tax=Paenibacillus sp. FSL R5-0701 TaxID=2921654 RepID=UPI0030CD2AE7